MTRAGGWQCPDVHSKRRRLSRRRCIVAGEAHEAEAGVGIRVAEQDVGWRSGEYANAAANLIRRTPTGVVVEPDAGRKQDGAAGLGARVDGEGARRRGVKLHAQRVVLWRGVGQRRNIGAQPRRDR